MTDREKLIALLDQCDRCNAEYCNQCEFGKDIDGCVLRQKEIIADTLLANGVTFATDTKVGDKWTPTDERRPENGVWVIAYQDCGWIGVAQIEEDGWHWYTQDLVKLSDPTHWMPLPEPPKEE